MKLRNYFILACASLAVLVNTGLAAPLPPGEKVLFVASQSFDIDEKGNPIPVVVFFPGDLLVFTGKSEGTYLCEDGKTIRYYTTVVVLDPTHARRPVLVSVLSAAKIPPGTRATLPATKAESPAEAEGPGAPAEEAPAPGEGPVTKDPGTTCYPKEYTLQFTAISN